MVCKLTEINRIDLFRLLSVTEIIHSPLWGDRIFGSCLRFFAQGRFLQFEWAARTMNALPDCCCDEGRMNVLNAHW